MLNLKRYHWKQYNFFLVMLVVLLSVIGVFMVSFVEAEPKVKKHIIGLFLGITVMLVVSVMDYHFICGLYAILYVVNVIMLLLVALFGQEQYSAKRWMNIGGFTFQPSELTKIFMIIFFAYLFTKWRDRMDRFSTLFFSAILMGIPLLFILAQPNLSTCILLVFIFMVMIFAAGLEYKVIFSVLAVVLPIFMLLFWYIQQPYQKLLRPYQQDRIMSMLHPERYPDLTYQQDNSIQAIGSGRLCGKFLLSDEPNVRGSKYVAVAESDFIFAVIGEELGFIGSCIILFLLLLVVVQCMITAKNARDFIGMLIAIGLSAMYAVQIFINVGVATSILPNTGQPLPFISYGLTSLVGSMAGIGLLLNIDLQRKSTRR